MVIPHSDRPAASTSAKNPTSIAIVAGVASQLAGIDTASVRGGGLSGTDLEAVAASLAGNRRGCVVPQYRDMATKAIDYALLQRTALYGSAVELPGAANMQRQWFSGGITFEEVPA